LRAELIVLGADPAGQHRVDPFVVALPASIVLADGRRNA